MDTIKILITDDHPVVREGWKPDPIGELSKPFPLPSATYAEMVFMLRAAVNPSHLKGRRTILELGAGFGPWLLTIHGACKQIASAPEYRYVGLEAHPKRVQWMQDHFNLNEIAPQQCKAIHGGVGKEAGHAYYRPFKGIGREYAEKVYQRSSGVEGELEIPIFAFNELIEEYTPIEMIHCDIQGAEAEIFDKATISKLKQHVARIGIATHSNRVGKHLEASFKAAGFQIVAHYKQRARESTPWGTVRFEDGWLAIENPAYCQE